MTDTANTTVSVGRLDVAAPQLMASADDLGPHLILPVDPTWSPQMEELVTAELVLHLTRFVEAITALELQSVTLTQHRRDGETVIRRVVGGDGLKAHLQSVDPAIYEKVTIDEATVWEPDASWTPTEPLEDKGVTDYL